MSCTFKTYERNCHLNVSRAASLKSDFRCSQLRCESNSTCAIAGTCQVLESSWNVMAHGDAREGKWRGNWRMEWVASTLHTTSEHGVSSITTADAHTSAASSRLNWRPRRFKWTRPFAPKDEIWFLRVCHHISNTVYSCGVTVEAGHQVQQGRIDITFPSNVSR